MCIPLALYKMILNSIQQNTLTFMIILFFILLFLKFFFLNVDHLKSLYWICYNTASFLCFGFQLQGMRFPTRDQTCTLSIGSLNNHWTAREVPHYNFKYILSCSEVACKWLRIRNNAIFLQMCYTMFQISEGKTKPRGPLILIIKAFKKVLKLLIGHYTHFII